MRVLIKGWNNRRAHGLALLVIRALKSLGMDSGHLEGQREGMFVVLSFFSQGFRSVRRFTGRRAFMLSVAMGRNVSHLSY